MFWDSLVKFLKIIVPVGLVLLVYYLVISKQKKTEDDKNQENSGESDEFNEHE